MAQRHSYVIVGNGIAGVTAAEILRAEDPDCALTIVADDPFPVYYRPALKDFLGGHLPEEKLWARPTTFYQEQDIRFIPARVTALNPQQHAIRLHNGKILHYHRLLLANGARPRRLACPGLDLAGVFTLRTVADYQQILSRLENARRVVVCGSGTLALESAETLIQRGCQVTHLLRGKLLWSEVLDPVASDMVLQEEQRAGIEVRTEEEITCILGEDGQVRGVLTTRGEQIPCELVLIAIGIEPVIDFIQSSGIACGRGVRVDHTMRTSSPDIYAAGDVVETTDTLSGRTRVPGQWFPAIQQAQVAAYHMLSPARSLPPELMAVASAPFYNATFLCGLDFVSIGLTTCPAAPGFQELLAEPQPRSYRKVILHNGCAVGALLLGDRRQALALKRAIDYRVNLSPVARQLFAEDFKLDAWLSAQGVSALLLTFQPESKSALSVTGKYSATGTQPRISFAHPIPDSILRALPDEPALVLLEPESAPRMLPLVYKRRYLLGRDARNDIILRDPSASRHHAELFCLPGGGFLRDLNSRYGVSVNQEKINAPTRLSHGDCVVIGDTLIYFSHPQTSAHGQPAETLDVRASKDADAVPEEPESVTVGLEHRRETAQLDKARLKFEIDMCIGCNRCMDACPVPGSSLVTIATLNTATITRDIPHEVARFTHECVMCGSCVPVCPVDNHRDLLMLSLKQRLGVSWEARPNMELVARALPGGWSLPRLLGYLREQVILRDSRLVPDTYLLHLIAASRPLTLKPQEMLLREGEYGRDLSLILEGQLELTVTDRDDRQIPLAILRRGEYVGEDGLLTGQPYKASARAQRPTLLFQVPEQVMQRLMELVPAVRQHFESFSSTRSLYAILKRMELFEGVAEADLQRLIRSTRVRQYGRGERLFAESRRGRPARETLHILLEGFVKVARQTQSGVERSEDDERIIAYRQGGDYFAGGLDLLGDGQAVTVTTINRCRVAEVPRQAVLALFQRYPHVEQRFALRLREYLEAAASTREHDFSPFRRQQQSSVPDSPLADRHVQAGLHELVSDGVVEGTEVLVIDLDRCIHCNECEEACARRHGHSRMNRKGMVVGNISIATACRQCQDPVCLLCSRAGIARRPNGEVYITESCIGCGICAERCPYGAISIAQVEDEAPARGSWQRFSAWFSKNANTEGARRTLPVVSATVAGGSAVASGPLDIFPPRGGYDELRKKIAIKCDLCAGYRDQACVQACPTGAAIRIQPTRFFGSTEEILRKRAQ
jgi:NADPH-dependent 2,4-dienoyl-CoA reductase/sulfur reductase-like enzyme/Fe-S-cluster-containing hydrogenase component 2/CRP-like cAMP-binding protein